MTRGRPSNGLTHNMRLMITPEMRADIERAAGSGNVAAWIREAIADKLKPKLVKKSQFSGLAKTLEHNRLLGQ